MSDKENLTLEEYIKTKQDALQLIIDIGIGYDGYTSSKGLENLIDEMVDIAKIGREKP